MEAFKVGDVVLLKSGGPKMTIESIKEEFADCVWFESNSSQKNTFNMACLQKPKVVTKKDILRLV